MGNTMLVLEEERIIAERFEQSVWKSSVTIGVVTDKFATGSW